jgi:hypothetical protein
MALFGGPEAPFVESEARNVVRKIAIQREIWQQLGTTRRGAREQAREQAIRRFCTRWMNLEKDELGNQIIRVVDGDNEAFAFTGDAELARMEDSAEDTGDGVQFGWTVVRNGFRGFQEYDTVLKAKSKEKVSIRKVKDVFAGDMNKKKTFLGAFRALVRK